MAAQERPNPHGLLRAFRRALVVLRNSLLNRSYEVDSMAFDILLWHPAPFVQGNGGIINQMHLVMCAVIGYLHGHYPVRSARSYYLRSLI